MRSSTVNERSSDMAERYEGGPPEPHQEPPGAYEHPALEPEPGYWAGRWAEFKRLLARSWHENGTKEGVVIGMVMVLIGIVWSALGWD